MKLWFLLPITQEILVWDGLCSDCMGLNKKNVVRFLLSSLRTQRQVRNTKINHLEHCFFHKNGCSLLFLYKKTMGHSFFN